MRVLITAWVVAASLFIGRLLYAQAPASPSPQTFEVATVKPSDPNPTGPLGATPIVLPALGRLTAQNVTLRMLVMTAYEKQPFQIVGGPSWQNANKFDVDARTTDAATSLDHMRIMLRALLADRFKLKTHIETREVPTYALTLARRNGKLGPKLTASTAACPDYKEQQQKLLEAIAKNGIAALQSTIGKPGETTPCSITNIPPSAANPVITIKGTGQSLDLLLLLLTQLSGRPVTNKTGLTGLYDFELAVSLQTLAAIYQDLGVALPLPAGLPEGPALMTTLQEDLGLKLDAQRGPGEVLVVDSAELPTPN